MGNRELASELGRQGIYIFPCIASGPNRKKPASHAGWRHISTCEEREIERLWRQFPEAAPGIDCAKSGFLVADLDRKNSDGIAWYADRFGDVDYLPGSVTPSGGRHVIYRNTDPPLGNGRGALPPKTVADIDIRGAGGFIVAPGSVFHDGGEYTPIGSLKNIEDAPPELVELLTARIREAPQESEEVITVVREPISDARKHAYGQAALAGAEAELAGIPEGDRNNTANLTAFRMGRFVRDGYFSQDEAYSRLLAATLMAGLSRKEAVSVVGRGLRDGARRGEPIVLEERDEKPAIDVTATIDALLGRAMEPEPPEEPEAPTLADIELPEIDLNQPGGVLEEMTAWIMSTSFRPNRTLAVASAIATLSAFCGRHLYAPTGTSLNVFMVCLASTGVGKDRPLDAPNVIMEAAGHPKLATSGKVFSKSALEQLIEEHPSCVAIIDEIGEALLQPIFSPKSITHQTQMKEVFHYAWSRYRGKSPLPTTRRAKIAGVSTPVQVLIPSPSLSLLGASTHKVFWESLATGTIADGFLNRLLVCEADERGGAQVVDPTALKVPKTIIRTLRAVVPPVQTGNIASALGVFDIRMSQAELEAIEVQMPWAGDGAMDWATELSARIDEISAANPVERQELITRVFEYTMRLAALHAVSRAGRWAEVSKDDLVWGFAWVRRSTMTMIKGVEEYVSASETQAMAKAVMRVMRSLKMDRVPAWKLRRALAHKYRKQDLDNILAELVTTRELLSKDTPTGPKGGRPATLYWLPDT